MNSPAADMYAGLGKINRRPEPFSRYTAETLWTDAHISRQMLKMHLDAALEPASRNHAFMLQSFDWMDRRFDIGPGMRICDLGCGPGFYTGHFAQAGARVTGVDFSGRSIRYARQWAKQHRLDIDYILQNYLTYTTDAKFDLITMIYCDLCPLGPAQRAALLGKCHDWLEDDGLLFLDVFSLKAFDQREEESLYGHRLLDGFWAASDYYGFLNVFKYEDEKLTVDKYTIIEPLRIWEIYNWLQYYSLETIHQEFADNGFRIQEYYADVAGSPYHPETTEIAVVARKIS